MFKWHRININEKTNLINNYFEAFDDTDYIDDINSKKIKKFFKDYPKKE